VGLTVSCLPFFLLFLFSFCVVSWWKAYLSSWGEANPGGGKDRVALFLERSKQDVIDARNSLGVILKILNSSTE
jgi:hypothetical protein